MKAVGLTIGVSGRLFLRTVDYGSIYYTTAYEYGYSPKKACIGLSLVVIPGERACPAFRHQHCSTHLPKLDYQLTWLVFRAHVEGKCIGDDTKAAARQSPNCIKKRKMAKNDFQYSRWNYYTLQCGMWLWYDMPLKSPKCPPYWIFTCGFDIDDITSVDMSVCTSLRNFIQIGLPSAEKNDVMSIFKMADLSHLGF